MRVRSRRPEVLLLVVADVLAAVLLAAVVVATLGGSEPAGAGRPAVAETSHHRDRLLEQYEAVQASKRTYPRGVPVVVVVSDGAPVDALVAGPAADVLGGPVLPVAQSGIANIVRRELSRLDPRRIVVVGGPGAVSDAVVRQLRSYTPGAVSRLAGENRYATAARVATAAFRAPVRHVVVTTGSAAAAAPPPAAVEGSPVLLVAADRVPPAIAAALRRLRPATVTVLGEVAEPVLEQLRRASPGATVARTTPTAR